MEIADSDTDVPILQEEDDEPINLDDIPDISTIEDGEIGGVEDTIFVNDSDDSEPVSQTHNRDGRHRGKRVREENSGKNEAREATSDDKKKLGMRTLYDGFSIYGRILCLMIKRRGGRVSAGAASSQQLMENWISTQAAQEGIVDED